VVYGRSLGRAIVVYGRSLDRSSFLKSMAIVGVELLAVFTIFLVELLGVAFHSCGRDPWHTFYNVNYFIFMWVILFSG